jgi:mRNA interferase YafQ
MTITWSKKMAKAVAVYRRAGNRNVLRALDDVTHLLAAFDRESLSILQERYRDHALKGHRTGFRELHLAQDDLMLYFVFQENRTIILENIVSHEELRKKG